MRGPRPWKTNRARVLRDRQVSAEANLWSKLRGRRLAGYKFIRQAPVAHYFADFLCRSEKVIVEVDGATHGSDQEVTSDHERTKVLHELGYRIFRTTNTDVYTNIDGVLTTLLAFIERTDTSLLPVHGEKVPRRGG